MINNPDSVDLKDTRTTMWWLEYQFEDGQVRKSIKMPSLEFAKAAALKAKKVPGIKVSLMSESTWVRTQNRDDLLP